MKPTLLVIDDQIMMTQFLAYYFRKDYEVVVRDSGKEALLWLEQDNIPKAIIADIDMTELSCIEFISALKKSLLHSNIPIIMLSAKERNVDRIECLKQGADDYLTKPFNPEELELKLKRLLNN